MRLTRLALLWMGLAMALLLPGCAGYEQRFDIVPRPLSVGTMMLWRDGSNDLSREQWHCVDQAQDRYFDEYARLVNEVAMPLVDEFKKDRQQKWRSDPVLMDHWISRHAALIARIELLDNGLISSLSDCGMDEAWRHRVARERGMERSRAIIEGSGAPILDLRELLARLPLEPESRRAIAPAMEQYAEELAPLLAALADAERTRVSRLQKAVVRLTEEAEAEAGGRAGGGRKVDDNAIQNKARDEAAAPVRKALGRVLDLALRTMEAARGVLETSEATLAEESLHQTVSLGSGGSASAAAAWIAELAMETDGVSAEARRIIRDELRSWKKTDEDLEDLYFNAMRNGEAANRPDRPWSKRSQLENDFLGRTMGRIPPGLRDRIAALRGKNRRDFEVEVMALAPASAARLLRNVPPGLVTEDPEPDVDSTWRPQGARDILLPRPVDDGWKERVAKAIPISDERRPVLEQLWRDFQIRLNEIRENQGAAVVRDEEAIGHSFGDPVTAGRAISALYSSVDAQLRATAEAEEGFLDLASALAGGGAPPALKYLRLERRLERLGILWQYMWFSDGLGFGPEAGLIAPDILDDMSLPEPERASAEAALIPALPELEKEAELFRLASLESIRRALLELSRAMTQHDEGDAAFRAALLRLASDNAPVAERHRESQREALRQVSQALPGRAAELERTWRRSAYPELFIGEATVEAIIHRAMTDARSNESKRVSISTRHDQWLMERDEADARLVARRRECIADSPARNDGERKTLERAFPGLMVADAWRREVDIRALRDVMILAADPATTSAVQAFLRHRPPATPHVYE